ncbi:hypothetical protein AMECASPLE_029640 [Ameca splendens]|uniref:Uncharacterized protein n=1 Tax=Ameca splendens TaxID=208324 RepID=A0ABV0Y5L4_9TELE
MQCYCTGAPAHPRCHIHSLSLSLCVSVQEEQNRGKPNWEHLNEDLHVLITVEDTQNRAETKMRRAVEEVKKLLVPAVSTFYTEASTYFTLLMNSQLPLPCCPPSFGCHRKMKDFNMCRESVPYFHNRIMPLHMAQ